MSNNENQVVIAWITTESVHDGKPYASDLGRRPKFKDVEVAHSLCWVLSGTDSDVKTAEAYCRRNKLEGAKVFTFPLDRADVLEEGRKRVSRERVRESQ